jgi:DeoR/GlpR family transcriptional regulator of sugar metabolism
MLDTERRQLMVQLVESRSSMTVGDLSDHFRVSQATIRRDLKLLSERGMIERAHGGAARRVRPIAEIPEPPLPSRAELQREEKRRIGRQAALLVGDRETIIISSGTTTVEMIPYLAERTGLTIITNALNIVLALASHPSITVIVIGGTLRHSELTLLGSLGENALQNLRADRLFMGSPAIHLDYGLSVENLAEARSDQSLMESAREVTVLADHTKFGKVATVRVCPVSRIKRIITGHELDSDIALQIESHGASALLV